MSKNESESFIRNSNYDREDSIFWTKINSSKIVKDSRYSSVLDINKNRSINRSNKMFHDNI